jgi:hypothetical protein
LAIINLWQGDLGNVFRKGSFHRSDGINRLPAKHCGSPLDSLNYSNIPRATANHPTHRLANLIIGGRRILFKQCLCRQNLRWRAVSALDRTGLYKGFLDRMQIARFAKTFYRRDLMTLHLNGEQFAASHRFPIE